MHTLLMKWKEIFLLPCLFLLWVVIYWASFIFCLVRCWYCLKVPGRRRVDLPFLFMIEGLFEAIRIWRFLPVFELGVRTFCYFEEVYFLLLVLGSPLETENIWQEFSSSLGRGPLCLRCSLFFSYLWHRSSLFLFLSPFFFYIWVRVFPLLLTGL